MANKKLLRYRDTNLKLCLP